MIHIFHKWENKQVFYPHVGALVVEFAKFYRVCSVCKKEVIDVVYFDKLERPDAYIKI